MGFGIHDASLPVLAHTLKALSAILKKGANHAKAKNIDPQVLLQSRLFPDMFPLVRQVQIATDMSKGGAARLAGIDNPAFPDTETSFAELQERLERTIAFIKSVKSAQIAGAESRPVTLQLGRGPVSFARGQDYLTGWVLPNVYFHVTTAYNILRHCGVELSKSDFLGAVPGAVMPGAPAKKAAAKKKSAASKATAKKAVSKRN